MSGYRHISDTTKRNSVENMAEDLIKDAVRIFKFRLLVQEPKCEVRWFENNSKIDTQFMKGGQWDDENLDDYVVNICYFPLIGMELNDPSKIKVCTHAKVFPRLITPPPSPSLSNEPEETSPKNTSFFGFGKVVGNFIGGGKKKNQNLPSSSTNSESDNQQQQQQQQHQQQQHHHQQQQQYQSQNQSQNSQILQQLQNTHQNDRFMGTTNPQGNDSTTY